MKNTCVVSLSSRWKHKTGCLISSRRDYLIVEYQLLNKILSHQCNFRKDKVLFLMTTSDHLCHVEENRCMICSIQGSISQCISEVWSYPSTIPWTFLSETWWILKNADITIRLHEYADMSDIGTRKKCPFRNAQWCNLLKWSNQQNDLCAQRRFRSACAWASAQSDQNIRCTPEKAWGSFATHWAQSEDSDQTGQMHRLISHRSFCCFFFFFFFFFFFSCSCSLVEMTGW